MPETNKSKRLTVGTSLSLIGIPLMVLSVFLPWLRLSINDIPGPQGTLLALGISGDLLASKLILSAIVGSIAFTVLALSLRRTVYFLAALACSVLVVPLALFVYFSQGFWCYDDDFPNSQCAWGPAPFLLLVGTVFLSTGMALCLWRRRRLRKLLGHEPEETK